MLTLEGQTKWIQAEMCETHGNEYITQIHESFLKYCRSLTLVSTKERISVCRRCSVCQTAIMTVILTAYNASNLSALAAAKRKNFHRCFCCIRLFTVRPRKTLEQCEWKIERYIHIYFPIEFCVLVEKAATLLSNAFRVLRTLCFHRHRRFTVHKRRSWYQNERIVRRAGKERAEQQKKTIIPEWSLLYDHRPTKIHITFQYIRSRNGFGCK